MSKLPVPYIHALCLPANGGIPARNNEKNKKKEETKIPRHNQKLKRMEEKAKLCTLLHIVLLIFDNHSVNYP